MSATSAESANASHRPPTIDLSWLARHVEPIVDPAQIIIDPHHHLWARETQNYMKAEALDDIGSGHRVVATVFVECWSGYRTTGPAHLRAVGETELLASLAGPCDLIAGQCNFIAGIVGHADLTSIDVLDEVLEAQLEAGQGRFRGIRHAVQFDATGTIPVVRKSAPGLLLDTAFQKGVARLAHYDLSFDAWLYQTQLAELIACARAAPDTRIILNHLGGPLAIGAYTARTEELSLDWKRNFAQLARCPNVTVKLGGLGMATAGHNLHSRASPPTSQEMADAYRDQILTAIDIFGPDRCMFESNFPVDKISGSYAVLWNAFKRLAAPLSQQEKNALFWRTAADAYRISATEAEGRSS